MIAALREVLAEERIGPLLSSDPEAALGTSGRGRTSRDIFLDARTDECHAPLTIDGLAT
jgi:hypothetical protein